jgi:hypothetical protein
MDRICKLFTFFEPKICFFVLFIRKFANHLQYKKEKNDYKF